MTSIIRISFLVLLFVFQDGASAQGGFTITTASHYIRRCPLIAMSRGSNKAILAGVPIRSDFQTEQFI